MFKNQNWTKVLVPEIVIVALTLSLFWGCQWYGLEEKETFAIVVVAIVVAAAFTIATSAFVFVITAVLIAFAVIAVAFAITSAALAVVGAFLVAFTVAAFTAKEYKLPKLWVFVSYLAEAAVIFFPIYHSLN